MATTPDIEHKSSDPADYSMIQRLEEKVQARFGRWSLSIMGTMVGLAAWATIHWQGLVNDVRNLESHQQAVEKWIDQREAKEEAENEFREKLSERLGRIEEKIDALKETSAR